jgi:hypothetical protein
MCMPKGRDSTFLVFVKGEVDTSYEALWFRFCPEQGVFVLRVLLTFGPLTGFHRPPVDDNCNRLLRCFSDNKGHGGFLPLLRFGVCGDVDIASGSLVSLTVPVSTII